jgi:flagellar protein FlaJ
VNGFALAAYRALGPQARKRADPKLQKLLQQAHLGMRADAFLATLWLASACAGAGVALLTLLLAIALHAPLALVVLSPLVLGPLAAGWGVALGPAWLQNRAKEVAQEIDEALPSGLNHMLALANAGMPPAQIWGSLARAEAFGALAREAARIHRDLALFSHDILTALRAAQERTPSKRFHEFLQGAISSFQSGVDLEDYLKTRGLQYQHAAQQEQAATIDAMGVMAEAFLVVVVAAPLFLMILLSVMAVSQGKGIVAYGLALSLIFLPLAQLVVGALIQGMNPKSW